MNDAEQREDRPIERIAAPVLFVLAIILAVAVPTILIWTNNSASSLRDFPLNNWGDFLAGVLGPASLLVLAASFLLQQVELRETRDTLKLQQRDLEHAAAEARRQSNILETQVRMAEWKIVKDELGFVVIDIMYALRLRFFGTLQISDFKYDESVNFLQRFMLTRSHIFNMMDISGGDGDVNLARIHVERYIQRFGDFIDRVPDSKELGKNIFLGSSEGAIFLLCRDWLATAENRENPPG